MIFSIVSPVFPLFLDGFPMKFPMVCHGHGLREVRATGMDAGGGAGCKYDRWDFLGGEDRKCLREFTFW